MESGIDKNEILYWQLLLAELAGRDVSDFETIQFLRGLEHFLDRRKNEDNK